MCGKNKQENKKTTNMQTNSPPKLDTTKHTYIFHYHKQLIVSPPKQNKQVIYVSPFLSRIDKDYLIRR